MKPKNQQPIEPILAELRELLKNDPVFQLYWETHATADNRATVVVPEGGFAWPF